MDYDIKRINKAIEMKLDDVHDSSQSEYKGLTEWNNNVQIFNNSAITSMEIIERCGKILDDFEHDINQFKEKTNSLQIKEHNTKLAMDELDRVINYHMIGTKYTSLLQSVVQPEELSKYIEALNLCIEAKDYFTHNMPDKSDISHLTYLIGQGQKNLTREIHSRLMTHFKNYPIDAVLQNCTYVESFLSSYSETKLDQHTESLEFPDINTLVEYNMISESDCDELKMIAKCLYISEQLTNEYIAFYEKARTSIIVTSLDILKERFLVMIPSDVSENKQIDNLELSGAISLNDGHILDTSNDVRNDSYYYVARMFGAIVVMVAIETKLMDDLIPELCHNRILTSILMALLERCESEVNIMIEYVRVECSKDDILIYLNLIVSMIPLIEFLFIYKPLFDIVIKVRLINPRRKLRTIIDTIQNEIFRILVQFKLFKEGNIGKHDSKHDANIHEFTSNTLTSIFSLVNYSNIIGYILENMKNVTKEQVCKEKIEVDFTEQSWDDNTWKLMKSIIGSLDTFLMDKSAVYPDNVSKSLFLINNYHFIVQRFLNYSTTNDLLLQNFINIIINDSKRKLKMEYDNFETCWLKVLGCLNTLNDSEISKSVAEFQYSGKNLNSKLKSQIKTTFKAFNTEIDTLINQIKTLVPPSKTVQRDLSEKILSMIVPVYENFIGIYGDIPFTTKTTKYIKYTKDSLTLAIQEIFVKRHGLISQPSIISLREHSRKGFFKKK